jgi:hypothetical protein
MLECRCAKRYPNRRCGSHDVVYETTQTGAEYNLRKSLLLLCSPFDARCQDTHQRWAGILTSRPTVVLWYLHNGVFVPHLQGMVRMILPFGR